MSRFRKVDPAKKKGSGLALVSRPDKSSAATVAPPRLATGQIRCPACRNGVRILKSGILAAHGDLFGNPCWNESPGNAEPIMFDLPPIDLARTGTNSTPPDGHCQECSKAIPPMRRLCGRCMARRTR